MVGKAEIKEVVMKNKSTIESHTPVPKAQRRKFLKKMMYSAPTLLVLGELAKPGKIHADFSGDPAGPPGGWTP